MEKALRDCELLRGAWHSCGCLRREITSVRKAANDNARRAMRFPEFRSWRSMIQRCKDPRPNKAARYRDRGIAVCERWMTSYDDFLADMGPMPGDGYSIDRIDNNRGYEPGNCRWATSKEQQNNRACTLRLTALGETLTVNEWAAKTGLTRKIILHRIYKGWDDERIVTSPAVYPNRKSRVAQPR